MKPITMQTCTGIMLARNGSHRLMSQASGGIVVEDRILERNSRQNRFLSRFDSNA
jgi:hypothetical protein